MSNSEKFPVYLDILKIRQPVTAILSLGHRISGILLFVALPFLMYLFDRSLSGPEGYAAVLQLFRHPVAVTGGFLLLWMFLHHLLAGVRFLFIDVDTGVGLRIARRTARLVLWGAPAITLAAVMAYVW